MKFTDAVAVAGTRRTGDGYLIADAKAVRTGIQVYLGSEVGRPDLETVRVYRSEDEVRSVASLRSFSHAPVTVDHPKDPVTADNWKALAVGEVSTAATWDGNRISLPLILKDAGAIKTVAEGKRELSAGYSCDLDWTAGKTPDGQAFDAQQKNIRANHVAIVDRGRAGPECRIGDADRHGWGAAPITTTTDKEKVTMSDVLRTVVVDGLSVSTTDQGAQAIDKLTKDRDTAAKALADANAAHAAAIAAKDAELAKKDAEIDTLKAKVPDTQALDAAVQARGDLIAKAKAIAPAVATDGKSDAEIRHAVVAAKIGDAAVKDKPAAYIDARFDILCEDIKPGDPVRDVLRGGVATGDHGVLHDDKGNVIQLGDSRTEYQRMLERDALAWKKGA